MISALFELAVLSLPTLLYVRRLRRRGETRQRATAAVGLQVGNRASYRLALLVVVIAVPVTYGAFQLVPTSAYGSSTNVSVGRATTPGGYAAIAILALAEEVLFRGLIAGLVFRRYGFAVGNIVQALIFLAPHLLLLLVSAALWPILPAQLIAGWLLGLLREKSASIGPPTLAHTATNLIAPLLLMI